MKRALVVLLLVACPLLGQTPSQVTIPLEQYETLRTASDRPSATVIDTVRLGGTFRGRDLTITFSGRSIGTRPQADVINGTQDVTIAGCTGAGILTRTARGAFAVIPTAETFDIRCKLRLSGSDRLEMHVPANVLAVESNVADGELITGDEDGQGGRAYSLVRQVASSGERLAATATGRYRITLLPDATRFQYAIDVHNPNRSTSTLVVALVSSEHLQQIDSAAPYEVEGNRYTFTIPPGDSTIAMLGELRGTSFRAPVEASVQYLVLESHPLLRPAVQTPAKRVSLAETGLSPQYRGALAFETGTQQIAWKVARLEALRATSYAASSATHTFFVPVDGPILGESQFVLRNEGAADLILPKRPEATFVSLGEEPVLMTKNAEGHLTVPLSTGAQTVLVQHRQSFTGRFGVGFGRVVVPQLDVPASQTYVRMTWPEQWIPLFESFARRTVFWTPDTAKVLLLLALALWIERLLAWLGTAAARRVTVAVAGALAATIIPPFLVLLVLACAVVTIVWITTLAMRFRIAAVLGVFICGALVLSLRNTPLLQREEPTQMAVAGVASDVGRLKVDASAGLNTLSYSASGYSVNAPAYQGLPAKFDLPTGSRATSFSRELLRVDREQVVRVFAISMALVRATGLLLALAVLFALFRARHALLDALRARTQVAPAAPVAEVPA